MGMGVSVLFWGRRKDAAIEPGSVFCRSEKGEVMETARVLSIADDCGGIPHVRFLLRKELGYQSAREEPRTLSLESFRSSFPERAKF